MQTYEPIPILIKSVGITPHARENEGITPRWRREMATVRGIEIV
jgi:hypothetical protein